MLGVNTGALLASAGVLGFAVGFGAQTMVKDLLNGLFLLAEGQYTIGDEITVSGVTGVVERVTLRTTTLRATNGDVHIVPSGDVRLVTNKSKGWSQVQIDAGIAYTTPVERAVEVLEQYSAEVATAEEVAGHFMEPPKVAGVTAFQDHQYVVRVQVKLLPSSDSKPIERYMRRHLRRVFEREGIETPVPVLALPSSGAASGASRQPASPPRSEPVPPRRSRCCAAAGASRQGAALAKITAEVVDCRALPPPRGLAGGGRRQPPLVLPGRGLLGPPDPRVRRPAGPGRGGRPGAGRPRREPDRPRLHR